MKDKNLAGILALFLGTFGVHRFYLGQKGLGIAYLVFFMTGIPSLLGIIDALVFFSMDQDSFDLRYNKAYVQVVKNRYRERNGRPGRQEERPGRPIQRSKGAQDYIDRAAELKKSGIAKYKDYDFEAAIEDFNKALGLTPNDVSIHFNLACAYSLTEKADEAFYHIDQAIGLGFNDFERLKTHDALAFLRVQERFDVFQKNGYRLINRLESPSEDHDLLAKITNTDLLEQLRKLDEMRKKGLLTEEEYTVQRRKLVDR